MNERISLDGKKKAELVKQIHEKARSNIEHKTKLYAKHANKGRKSLVFEEGDMVWIHLRKERFPNERKSKLMPRIDGPFKIIKKLNDNAYQLDLQGKYTVSSSFNVTDLSPYFAEETDLRTNPSQVGEDDESVTSLEQDERGKDHEDDLEEKDELVPEQLGDLEMPLGVITRSKQAQLKTKLQHLLTTIQGSLGCANPTTLVVIQAI